MRPGAPRRKRGRSQFHVGARAASQGEAQCPGDTRPELIPRENLAFYADPVRHSCKLAAGHEGKHDPDANWNGFAEVETDTFLSNLRIELETRHQHGGTSMKFEDAEQVARFCEWLTAYAAKTWPNPGAAS